MADLFVEEATVDMTGFGMRLYDGLPAIRAYFEKEASVLDGLMHVTSNHRIDVVGETATGTAYFLAIAITKQGNENQARGYYDDRYRLTDDGWRFASRRMCPLLSYSPVIEQR